MNWSFHGATSLSAMTIRASRPIIGWTMTMSRSVWLSTRSTASGGGTVSDSAPSRISMASLEAAGFTVIAGPGFVPSGAGCGGVQGCHDMCSGHAPELEDRTSFVGRWMDILRPGYERVAGIGDEGERVKALEKQAVVVSLENLMTFPFVKAKVEAGDLSLHGLWTDTGEGELHQYDAESGGFIEV